MLFRLETEALERERLAAIAASPPTATKQTGDHPSEEITDTAQEELAPSNRPSEDAHTVPDPVEEEVSPLDPTPPPEESEARADMRPRTKLNPPQQQSNQTTLPPPRTPKTSSTS